MNGSFPASDTSPPKTFINRRYFESTLEIFRLDRSVYCISSVNPLYANTQILPDDLLREDIFGIYTKLITSKLADEITSLDVKIGDRADTVAALSEVMTWPSHRRARGCIYPAIPRVCSGDCTIPTSDQVFDLEK